VQVRQTRRELVGGAALAVAAGAAVSLPDAALAGAAPADSDVRVLRRTLAIEQLVVFAYRHTLASGKLHPGAARLVGQILGQELVHVATLERALATLGAEPPAAPRDLASAQQGFSDHHMDTSLAEIPDQNACLRLLVDVESVAEGAYFEAIGKLTDARLLRTSCAIMGCEAQHWTLLSALRHHGDVLITVPYPFVGGSTA
jgi:Ferritin-like domain